MASPLQDPKLEALLDRLHAQSDAQVDEMDAYFARRAKEGTFDATSSFDDEMHRFFADKLVALDRDKAEFCYQLCRATGASRVVEAGTSFGVSTLYLAAAVRDNDAAHNERGLGKGREKDLEKGLEKGIVIGTEYEPKKAEIARTHFAEAGLSDFVELREGDLRETLKGLEGPVDFLLLDIWEVALPALERVAPSLRAGAIVACDNTATHAHQYRDYFEYIRDPVNRFRTMTLPFEGGFELTVRT
jgi:predicted O-methyltransferase YrrM